MDTVAQEYWDKSYNDFDYFVASNDAVTSFLDKHLSDCNNKTVFEIGCFPLRYLSYVGKKGAIISGCDLTPEINSDKLKNWLQKENIAFENLYHGDYTKFISEKKQFDIVISMGFVEHFYNFDEVINNHLPYLKKGGKLIITAPNFVGKIQKKLHTLYDFENLQRHHLPSMDIEKWKNILKDDTNIVYADYFGKIDFWADKKKRSFSKKIGYFFSKNTVSILKKISFLLPNTKSYSPYLGIVAIKK